MNSKSDHSNTQKINYKKVQHGMYETVTTISTVDKVVTVIISQFFI